MKRIILTLAAILVTFACMAGHYAVKGTYPGCDELIIRTLTMTDNEKIIHRVELDKDGNFKISGYVEEPMLVEVSVRKIGDEHIFKGIFILDENEVLLNHPDYQYKSHGGLGPFAIGSDLNGHVLLFFSVFENRFQAERSKDTSLKPGKGVSSWKYPSLSTYTKEFIYQHANDCADQHIALYWMDSYTHKVYHELPETMQNTPVIRNAYEFWKEEAEKLNNFIFEEN